ncbi:bile acid:sodium symporter, partial [Escherichia sp. R-CC3]
LCHLVCAGVLFYAASVTDPDMMFWVIVVNVFMARRLGFNKADEITIVFCGSKKSLANGIPMANILFPTSVIGMMVLPLMIFHQIQLMVCAVLARRYKRQTEQLQAQQESSADKA